MIKEDLSVLSKKESTLWKLFGPIGLAGAILVWAIMILVVTIALALLDLSQWFSIIFTIPWTFACIKFATKLEAIEDKLYDDDDDEDDEDDEDEEYEPSTN